MPAVWPEGFPPPQRWRVILPRHLDGVMVGHVGRSEKYNWRS